MLQFAPRASCVLHSACTIPHAAPCIAAASILPERPIPIVLLPGFVLNERFVSRLQDGSAFASAKFGARNAAPVGALLLGYFDFLARV